jgi:Protein of unknown function (DUF2516)/Family of unknown function (DUF5652)
MENRSLIRSACPNGAGRVTYPEPAHRAAKGTNVILALSSAYYIPGFLVFIFTLIVLIDAATKPDSVWEAAGKSKAGWIIVLAIGLIFGCVGLIAGIIYLASVRPSLTQAGPPAY